MTKDTSGPAYPCLERGGNGLELTHLGMTLRQLYAGLAMQGTIASQTPDESIDPVMCAQWCFQMADAMLAEGSK